MKSFIKVTTITVVIVSVVMLIIWGRLQERVFTNAQAEEIYRSQTHIMGFSSTDYTVTNYDGDKDISIPASDKRIHIANSGSETSADSTYYLAAGKYQGVNISTLGGVVRVCYKNKPFYQSSRNLGINCDSFPIRFSISETTINGNSFVIIGEACDFHGYYGGLYVNGNIVSQYIIAKGSVAYLPISVKKVGGKVMICFESINFAFLYVMFNPETNQLILPTDYESVENKSKF
ncbi:MAG: hypothetical protein WCT50_02705 [Patescibacteria group bacterium]